MSRLAAVAVSLVTLTVLVSPLRRELYVGDETKYAQVVREMRGGAVFLPTLHGSPFTHKPPLHFWIVDALTYPLGLYSIWPFVLPSLVAFGLLMWLMGRWGGPIAAFVCASALMVWGSAQTARMDIEFTALLALAAWMVQRGKLVPAGIATGIAFLIKGPMAPVILLALFALERWRLAGRSAAGRRPALLMLLAMFGIPLLWFVPALLIGGEPFFREVFFKQTVGRAVGAWVHRSPPWFYVMRAPLTLLPWFFLLVVAIVAVYKRNDERGKFAVSWILAVLVPYSLLSSKLDVYMMAMIPPVALAIASLVDVDDRFTIWGRRANLVMLALFALIGVAGLVVRRPEVPRTTAVLALFAILLVAATAAMLVTWRGRLATSIFATGLVPIVALAYAAVALVPLANEMASTRPLVRALVRQNAPPESIGLFVCPHLWTRDMPPELARVRYLDAQDIRVAPPQVLVARRKDAHAIADVLRGYRKVDELQMIGKWFDVYRR